MSLVEAALVPATIINREGGGSWFLTGPAGSGKTWVLGQVADAAEDRPVYWLRAAGMAKVGLAAAMEPAIESDTLADVAEALMGGVLLVDDVHLLDEPALHDLGALASRAEDDDLALIVTERSGSSRPDTAMVAARCSPVTLDALDPLRPTFRELVGELTDEETAELLRTTGGWYELVAACSSDGDATVELVRPRFASLVADARRLAVVLAFGASLHDGSAERLLGVRGDAFDRLLGEVESSGLLHGGQMVPTVADALRDLVPVGSRRDELEAFLASDLSGAIESLADWLIVTTDRSPEAVRVMVRAAQGRQPAAAAPLLEAAVHAGAGPDVATQWVATLLRLGRSREALAEAVRAGLDGPVLRASLARAGRVGDAAKLENPDDLQAAIAAASVGLVETAERALSNADVEVVGPSATAAALAVATVALVRGDDTAARLTRDARRLAGDGVDTGTWGLDPALCASIVATSAHIESVGGGSSTSGDSDQVGAFAALEQVIAAWQSMRAGRLQDAKLATTAELDPLEAALSAVVAAGVALRADNLDALAAKVTDALRAIEAVQIDAWRLPVAVELLAPAARSGVGVGVLDDLCQPLLEACTPSSLLRLAHTASALLAAIAVDDAEAVQGAVSSFETLEGTTRAHDLFASVVPVVADVFAGDVDPDAVLEAAAALRDSGLVYDAGRLTGAAAMRCTDERQTKALLRESRAMRQERKASVRSGSDVTELSEREVEVARLVVQGRTHKEVGATLFISAKTVEHHVARIRNKLGASGRAEMMAAIRDYLDATDNLDG